MITEVFNQNSKYYRQMMDIILAAKVNPPEKGQVHHIIPRCWFKHYHKKVDNSISNIVLLTWEDHKLVHSIAYKCAKESWFRSCMAYASHRFGNHERDYTLSDETKRKIGEANKGRLGYWKNKKFSEEHKLNLSEALKGNVNSFGNKHTNETKIKISEAMKGRKCKPFTEEHKINISKSHIGMNLSVETKDKISKKMKGKNLTDFGIKFKEHYGITSIENVKLHRKEYRWYLRHGKCRWE